MRLRIDVNGVRTPVAGADTYAGVSQKTTATDAIVVIGRTVALGGISTSSIEKIMMRAFELLAFVSAFRVPSLEPAIPDLTTKRSSNLLLLRLRGEVRTP